MLSLPKTCSFLWVAARAQLTTMLWLKSVAMYVHIFGERRFSEQFPILGLLWLSENCCNALGVTLLKIDRHNFHVYNKRASRRFFERNFPI